MKKDMGLGKAEWKIMEGLWTLGKSVSVREVHQHLYPHGEKAYTTVQTTMVILADKGFLKKEKKLLKVGARTIWSTAKRNAISVPVAVLVNSKTVGSAEALAALMRRSNVGLLIGADTAGGVSQFREFTLSNGQRLRVATGPLLFGEGEVLVGGAVQPDIEIDVAVEDELAYLDNAYRILPDDLSTLQAELEPNPFRPLSEAEIVRRHKLEQGEESVIEEKIEDVEAPLESEIRDPALSRALDVLKALAVVRKIHPF